jgi:hypothetical protein
MNNNQGLVHRPPIEVTIYVTQHCPICAYASEVAENIRHDFPQVELRIIDLATTSEPIPEAVFATPTYLLNGRVWSLGNPSPQQVTTTLHQLLHA